MAPDNLRTDEEEPQGGRVKASKCRKDVSKDNMRPGHTGGREALKRSGKNPDRRRSGSPTRLVESEVGKGKGNCMSHNRKG